MSTKAVPQRDHEGLEEGRRIRAGGRAGAEMRSQHALDAITGKGGAAGQPNGMGRARPRQWDLSVPAHGHSPQTIYVSATEAKTRFGGLLGELSRGTDAIVIERHGRPCAVLVSAEDWAALIEARERLRRKEAWDQLWKLAAEGGVRNADLTQVEADAISDELGDEAKHRVASRLIRQ